MDLPFQFKINHSANLSHTFFQEEPQKFLFSCTELPSFDQIKPSYFLHTFHCLLEKIEPKLKEIESQSSPSFENTLLPLEIIEQEIYHIIAPMEHLRMVKDSYEMRQVWAQLSPLLTALSLRIHQSLPLFKAYHFIQESEEYTRFSPLQKRILKHRLLEAKLSGADLDEEKKEALSALISKLNILQASYNANILDAIKDFSFIVTEENFAHQIPEDVLRISSKIYNLTKSEKSPLSTPSKGPWKLILDPVIYRGVLCFCSNREIRKKLYQAHILKASFGIFDNSNNLFHQLKLRKEIATILGFRSYAELSLSKKMAPDVKNVRKFLHDLRDACWETGKEDLEALETFAQKEGFNSPLMPWDFAFFSEKVAQEKWGLSSKVLKEYFSFQGVLKGLFDLCHLLFDITITPAPFKVSTWHPDVTYYLVEDSSGKQIASFYLDPYSRPETKRGGAWMESCRNRLMIEDQVQLPIAYIVCNFSPPMGKNSVQCSFMEVKTLFHEFGHALQHMLTKVNYPSISGINGIEWDAIEIVSQFMENWCYHRPTLKKISAHYLTNEPLPDSIIDKLIDSRTHQSSLSMLNQLRYGLADLEMHDQFDPSCATFPFKIWDDICARTSHFPCLEKNRFICSFYHIFGNDDYAAGYYSYKWAEVISIDAFSAFERAGFKDEDALKKIGKKFKKSFLELGGSLHPIDVFKIFCDRSPSITPLLKHYGIKNNP